MKIKNKHALFIGIMTSILAIICLVAYMNFYEQKFLISCLLFTTLSTVNSIKAFNKKGILEEVVESADERDLYLSMKTSHLVIKSLNYALCFFTFIFLILYAIWKHEYFIIVAVTLSLVLVLIFIVYLIVNIYLEKQE